MLYMHSFKQKHQCVVNKMMQFLPEKDRLFPVTVTYFHYRMMTNDNIQISRTSTTNCLFFYLLVQLITLQPC